MNTKIAFVSCCFGDERYIEQQKRLVKSIKKFHPEATIVKWTNDLPTGASSMNNSMYGFKVHAINELRKAGYTKIIWLDTACIIVDRMDKYFDLVKQYGVVAIQDDNLLDRFCSDEAYSHFGYTRNQSFDQSQHLVGGSVFVFDFELPLCRQVFTRWERSEKYGLFGTASTQGHRHDEACMALALYASGSTPVPYGDGYYNNVPKPLVIKKHFK